MGGDDLRNPRSGVPGLCPHNTTHPHWILQGSRHRDCYRGNSASHFHHWPRRGICRRHSVDVNRKVRVSRELVNVYSYFNSSPFLFLLIRTVSILIYLSSSLSCSLSLSHSFSQFSLSLSISVKYTSLTLFQIPLSLFLMHLSFSLSHTSLSISFFSLLFWTHITLG